MIHKINSTEQLFNQSDEDRINKLIELWFKAYEELMATAYYKILDDGRAVKIQ